MSKEEAKEWLVPVVSDIFMDFLYYDRKEDYEMGHERLRKLMDEGVIPKEMMIQVFTDQINKGYK